MEFTVAMRRDTNVAWYHALSIARSILNHILYGTMVIEISENW